MKTPLRIPATVAVAAAALTLVTGAAVAAVTTGITEAAESAKTAGAPVDTGDTLGKSIGEIAMRLEQHGYIIHEIESEDGLVEAEAVLERQEFEIYVDPATGTVVEVERE